VHGLLRSTFLNTMWNNFVTIDLCMNWIGVKTFALIVNFLNWNWVPFHVTIGLFEATNTSGVVLIELVKCFKAKFQLTNKFFTCVKDECMKLAYLLLWFVIYLVREIVFWDMWCWRFTNMLQMRKRFVKSSRKSTFLKPMSHGQNNWAKGGKNGKLHVHWS